MFVSALVGDLWRVISPFPALAAVVDRLRGRPAGVPYLLGHWPAVGLLFGFVWLELAYPDRADPRQLAVAIIVYTAVVLAGAARWGEPFLRQGEAFAAFFGLLAAMAPVYADDEGRLRLRPPLSGLATMEVLPGTVAMIIVALGSTTFDGLSRTRLWVDRVSGLGKWPLMIALTLGLVVTIVLVGAAYVVAMKVAAARTGRELHQLTRLFAHTLVPIVFAYAVAHYFSYLLFEGQAVLSLVSDPFGQGWDLFGTAEPGHRLPGGVAPGGVVGAGGGHRRRPRGGRGAGPRPGPGRLPGQGRHPLPISRCWRPWCSSPSAA